MDNFNLEEVQPIGLMWCNLPMEVIMDIVFYAMMARTYTTTARQSTRNDSISSTTFGPRREA
jgi:hypothetical protein